MKLITLLIFILISSEIAFAQKDSLFKIETFEVKRRSERKSINDFKRESINFYEDTDFIANSFCGGEFGGILRFKEKKTGNIYECKATCPVIVNRLNGKYFITNTLAHLSGHVNILEIDDPRMLTANPFSGIKEIISRYSILTLGSFPYNGRLYYIITDYKETYLSVISNNYFENIQVLADESIWTYNPELIKMVDNHYVVFFKNETVKGYLDIYGNEIKIYRYK